MSIITGRDIKDKYPDVISPLEDRGVFLGMSFGISSAGVDIRLDKGVILYPPHRCTIGNFYSSFGIAISKEKFSMPNNLMGMVKDKSTWARQGLSVFNTVIEPGWRGYLTLELVNHSRSVIDIQSGSPIAQVVFQELSGDCEPYRGKYNDAPQIAQPAKFEE